MRTICLAGGLVLQLIAAAVTASPPWLSWHSTHGVGHPLAARVLDVGSGRWIAPRELLSRLSGARYVVLGERHDNADHHRLQAWIVESLVRQGRRPAVAFEMLEADRQQVIDACLENCADPLAELPERVRWSDSGWPPWELYRPVFAAALEAGLPLVSASAPRSVIRAVADGDTGALDDDRRRALALDEGIPPPLREDLASTLRAAHCGYAAESRLPGLVRAQWARDAFMASRLREGASADGAVLIAGNGHARRDWGVAYRLRDPEGRVTVASVAMLEVRRGETAPAAYLPGAPGSATGAGRTWDFVWFTPRTDDRDPCEKFRDQLQDMEEDAAPAHGGRRPAAEAVGAG